MLARVLIGPPILLPPPPPAPRARVRSALDGYETRAVARGRRTALDEGVGRRVAGRRRKRARGGREGAEVGEQYLGDFALYLEMSFVGSISSTIRTLSLCPGSVSGCWFCSCLSVSANRYTPYMSLPSSPPLAPVFSSSLSPPTPPNASFSPSILSLPLSLSLFLSFSRPSLSLSLPAARTNVYVYLSHQPAMCTNRIVATSISR